MYCNKCGKQIAEDSLFCSYCGASQPEIFAGEPQVDSGPTAPQETAPLAEPYEESLFSKIFGKIIGFLLLLALAIFVYILSKNRLALFEGMTTVMERIFLVWRP